MKKFLIKIYLLIGIVLLNISAFSQVSGYNADLDLSIATPVPHCEQVPLTLRIVLNKTVSALTTPLIIEYSDPLLGPQSISGITVADFDITGKIYEFSVPGYEGDYILTGIFTSAVAPNDYLNISGDNTVAVSILAGPTATITPDPANTSINTDLVLSSNTSGGIIPYTYSWAVGGLANITPILPGANATFNSLNPGSYNVTYQVTDANGCIGTDNVTVTVINLQATIVSPADPADACVGAALALDADVSGGSGSYTYSWSYASGGTGSFSSTAAEDPTFTPNAAVPYTLTFTVTDLGVIPNVSNSATLTVNPIAQPSNTKTVNVVNKCFPDNGSITVVNSEAGIDYELFESVSGTIGTIAGVAGTDIVWTNLVPGSYYIEATNASNCTNTFVGPYIVGDFTKPTVTAAPDDPNICLGTTTTLRATPVITQAGASLASISWTWDNPSIMSPTSTTANPITEPTTVGTTNYQVVVTDDNGCFSDISIGGETSITVSSAPVLTISGNSNICEGETTTLSATSTKAPASWDWDGGGLTSAVPAAVAVYTPLVGSLSIGNNLIDLVVTDATGCSTTETFTITVNENPTASINGGILNEKMCSGVGTTLTGSATGGDGSYDYLWSNGDNTITTNVNPAANTNYALTVSDGNGCVDTDDIDVVVNDLPTVVPSVTTDPICLGAPTVLNANAGATLPATITSYLWSNSATLSSGGVAAPTATPVVAGTNTYTVTVTDSEGCQNTGNIDVNVKALPVIAINSSSNPVCSGSTTILSGTSDKTVDNWFWDADVPVVSSTIGNNSVSPVFATSYSLTVEDSEGCISTANYMVNINSLPVANAGGIKEICKGQSTVLTGSATGGTGAGTYDYSWTSGDLTATTTVNPTVNTTYTLMVTDDNGCVDTDNADVVVNELPVVNPSAVTSSICLGASTVLNSNATVTLPTIITSYLWSNSATLSSGGAINPSATPVVAGTNTYTVTVTDSKGCKNSGSTDVNVKALPVIAINSADNPVCSGSTTTLSGTSDKTVDNWFWDANAPVASATIGTYSVSPTVATTYDLTVEDSEGCISTVSHLVNIYSLPVANAGGAKEICKGQSTTLTGSATGGTGAYNYSWTSGDVVASTTVSPSINTTYTLLVTDGNGCKDNDDATVTVNGLPAVTASTDITPVCIGSSTAIEATAIPVGPAIISSYLWTNSGTLSSSSVFNPIATPTASGINTYTVIVTDSKGCQNTASTDVIALLAPNISISSSANPICIGGSTSLSVSSDKTIVSWDWNGGASVTSNYIVNPTIPTTYNLTVVDDETCSTSATYTINVNSLPLVSAGADQTICSGETVLLDGFASGNGPFNYLWTTGETTEDISLTPLGNQTFDLTVIDNNNCQNTDEVDVIVNPLPIETFTIDGISYNDNGLNFCDNGSSVALIGTGIGNNSFSGTGVSGAVFNPSSAGIGTYTIDYTHTDVNGCTNTVTSKPIEVLFTPDVDIADLDPQYCENDGVFTISGNSPNGATSETFTFPDAWTLETEYTDNGDGTFDIDPLQISLTGTYSITYEVTDNNGCISSTTESMDILPLQSINFSGFPAIVAPAVNSAICKNGNSITLIGSPKDPQGSFSGDGINDNNDGTAEFDPSVVTVGTHTITYSYEDLATNCINSISKDINVLALPQKFIVTSPGGLEYCETDLGITVGISGSQAPAPDGYKYYLIQNGLTRVDTIIGTGAALNFAGNYPAGSYQVDAENAYGCQVTFNNTIIAVEEPTVADAGSITGTISACANGDSIYTYSVAAIANATDHLWITPTGVTIDADRDNEIDVKFDPSFVGGDFEVYGTDITSVCPAGNSSILTVAVKPAPTDLGASIMGDDVVCKGETNKFYSIDPLLFNNETSFEWKTTSGTIISDPTASGVLLNYATVATSGTLSVRAVNSCSNSAWVTLPITVNSIPDVSIDALGAGDVITCAAGSQVQLFTSTIEAAPVWLWSATNGGVILAGDETVQNPRVTNEGTFVVQIEVTTAGQACYNTDTVIVLSDKTPPTISIPGTYEIDCDNLIETINAIGDPDPTTYLWTGPGVTAPNNGTSVTVNAPGPYTLTATATNACTASKNIVVVDDTNPPDVIVAAALDLTCDSTSVEISGSSPTADVYTWTRQLGEGNITNTNSAITSVDGPGTFRLTVETSANGCSSYDEVTVIRNDADPGLAVVAVEADEITCSNPNVQLESSAIAGAKFRWYTGIAGATISDTTVANPYVNKPGIYTVVATHPITGCSETADVIVNINKQKPTPSIVTTTSVITCKQDTINLDASGSSNATSFIWYTNDGTIVNGGSDPVATIRAEGTYNVIITNGATGCTDTGQVVITEDVALPNVNIIPGPYTITCNDPQPILSATTDAGATVLWTGPGIVGDPSILSPSVDTVGTYIITATAANGCTSQDNVLVQPGEGPPNIWVDTTTLDITCMRDTAIVIGGSTTPGVTFQWQMLTGGGTVTNDDQKIATVNAPGTYEFTVTEPNGCTSSDIVTVGIDTIAPVIILAAQDDDTLTCKITDVKLNVSSIPANVLFSWSTSIDPLVANMQDITSATPTVEGAGKYSVLVTDQMNGCTSTDTIEVISDDTPPALNIAAVAQQISCTNKTITLDASASTNATNYTWTATMGGNILSVDDPIRPIVNAEGRYTLTAENTQTGCTASVSRDVFDDNSIPQINITTSPNDLNCIELTRNLTADDPNILNKDISWTTFGSGVIDTDPTLNDITVSAPGTYTVKIINTDNGCDAYAGVTVGKNNTPPTVSFDIPNDLTCTNTDVDLKVNATSANGAALQYSWTPGIGGIIDSGPLSETPKVSEVAYYIVTVTDVDNFCFTEDSVYVDIDTAKVNVSVKDTPDMLTCTNATVTLEGSSTYSNISYNWETSNGGAILYDNTTTPIVDAPGTYNLEVTNEDNGCISISSDVVVTKDVTKPNVTPFFPAQELTCSVTEVTISVSPGVNYRYLWTGPSPGTVYNPTSNSPDVNAPGTYTVVVEDINNNCDTSLTINVTQNILESDPPNINNIDTCFGSATNPSFTLISGTNVHWYGDVNMTIDLGGPASSYTPTKTSIGNHTYYATSTSATNGCESNPVQVIFTVHGLPEAPSTFGNAICEGDANNQLTAIGSEITWYNNASIYLNDGSIYVPDASVSAAGTYTYYATQTDGLGCESPKKSASYVINSVPGSPSFINPAIEICETETNPIFTILENNNIQWYKNIGGAVVSTGNSYQPIDIIPNTYNYYVTQTISGCESPEALGIFTINPMPEVYNVINGGAYCEGSSGIDISLANSETGVNYELWIDEATMVTDTAGTTGLPLSFGNQTLIGNYTVYAYNAVSLCRYKMNASVDVSIDPKPGNAPTIIGSTEVCQSESGVSYKVDPISDATNYEWTLPEGFTIASGSNSRSITVNVEDTAISGNITVYATNACGVGITSPNLYITVNPIPGDAMNLIGDNVICNDDDGVIYSIDLDANATQYNWTLPQGASIVAGAGSRQVTLNFDQTAVNDVIIVAAANACGEGASASKSITVNNLPYVNAGNRKDLCVDNAVLDANTPVSGTGTWTTFNGAVTFPNNDEDNPVADITNIGEGNNRLVWTVEDENGCILSDTVLITNNTVNVEAGNSQPICEESYILNGSAVPTGAIGNWTAKTGSARFSDGTDPKATASDFASGTNILKWSIQKGGCTNYDTVIIDNQRPTEANAGIDFPICGDSTVLNANNPVVGSGLWTVVIGAASFEDDTLYNTKVSGLSKGENVLRWTISNGICATSDELTITNNKLNVDAGGEQAICDNTTQMKAADFALGTGSWKIESGSGFFDNENEPETTVRNLAKGKNVFIWEINNYNCISSASVSIINNSPTTANAGEDSTILTNTISLQANDPEEGIGTWSLLSGSAVINDNSAHNTMVTDIGLGNNVFRWTIEKESCNSMDEVIITNQIIQEPNAGGDQTICDDFYTLDGNASIVDPENGGEWSIVAGSGNFVDAKDPETEVTGLSKGVNIFKWTLLHNGGLSDEVVIINDAPTKPNAGLDQVKCLDSITLAGNEPVIGSGLWTILSGSGTIEHDTLFNTKVTNLSKGDNTFRWKIENNGCADEDIVVITNDLPTPAKIETENPLEVCLSTITLNTNTPSIGTGLWEGPVSVEGNIAKNVPRDTSIFVWTIENNACSSSDSITVINNEPSYPNAGSNKIICTDTLILAANPPVYGTGIWKQESGTSTFDVNDPTTKVTDLSQGLNVFKWTISYNSCEESDRITINNASVTATTGLDQVICSESTNLEANNPSAGIGTWTILGGSGSATFTNRNDPGTWVTGLDKGTNTLRWTVVNEICSDTSDVIITNNVPTEPFAGPDRALCRDNTILQANTPLYGTGSWSVLRGSADFVQMDDPSSAVDNLGFGDNTLQWTIKNGSCSLKDQVVISNNSTINSNAGFSDTLCTDFTQLYANIPAPGVGAWSVVSGSATFEDNSVYNTKAYNLGKGENILKWVIINGACSSEDEVTIVNNSPITAIAGADKTICGNTTYLQANNQLSYNGSWSLVGGAASFANNSLNNTQVTGLNFGRNTLKWTIENNGCTSSDDVVIYNDLPYVADAGADFEICGTTSPLYANDPVTGIGEWTVVSGNAIFDDASRYDVTVSDLGFGANTLRWTITYESCTTIDELVVVNNKLDIYAGVDQTVTEPTTLLAASNPSTGTGEWSVIGGSGNFVSPNNSITEVSQLGSGINTYRWSVDINNCISFDDVSITYNILPVSSMVITQSEGCPPLDVYFINNSLDGLPFKWDFDDGDTSNMVTIKHTFNDPGIYKPSLTIIGNNGEVIVKDTLITVYDQPNASFLIVNKEVYIPEEEAIFINSSTDAVTYEWEFGNGETSTESDPRYVYDTEGVYDIILHAWSENDCYDSTIVVGGVEVYESGTFVFPTAFTPNLDGSSGGVYNQNDFSNDVFYPIGDGIIDYHLEIFNRWGVLVFESSDIAIGWDGYYDNKLLDEGVYVWKVTGKYNNGKDFNKVGTIMLLH